MFVGFANDPIDGDISPTISWTSDLDGPLGVVDTLLVFLSDGRHKITASATNSLGKTGKDARTVLVGIAEVVSISAYGQSVLVGTQDGIPDLTVAVIVVDASGNPVQGARVDVLFENTTTGSRRTDSKKTTQSGRADLLWKDAPPGCYTNTILRIVKPYFIWDGITPPHGQICK